MDKKTKLLWLSLAGHVIGAGLLYAVSIGLMPANWVLFATTVAKLIDQPVASSPALTAEADAGAP